MRATLTLISMILATVQTVSVAAYADVEKNTAPEIIALARPLPSPVSAERKALVGEASVSAAQNQFVPGVAIFASNFSGDEAARLAKEGVTIGTNSGNNYLELQSGNVLLNPEKDLTVATQSGKIHVGAGAFAFVINSGEDVVIYDLLQTEPKQVVVTVNKHNINLEPGRMVVLTKQELNDFEQLPIDCHRVNYCHAQFLSQKKSCDSLKVFEADFSITSAMVSVEPLKRLTVSNNREDRLAMERMLKGAVVMGGFFTETAQPDAVEYSLTNVDTNAIQAASESDKTIASLNEKKSDDAQ